VGFLSDIGSAIMTPLYYLVSGMLLVWHKIFSVVLDPAWGGTWILSIIGLTVTIRTLLIPLFVKQIKSSRNMQLLQPQLKALQKKYKHDRQKLQQEQMKLFQETGTNPLASCMPLLLQMPVFFALFRVIDHSSKYTSGNFKKGFITEEHALQLSQAKFLGAKIADTFTTADHLETRILAALLVIVMCATQFITQRQLMAKNMPADAMSGPYAQQQKMLLYILPFVFAFSGVIFPLGVLFYWVTSNLWTMGQQFYVIRNNPAPGTPAFKAKQERDARKGRNVAEDPLEAAKQAAVEESDSRPKRNQPKKQSRSQRSQPKNPPKSQPKKASADPDGSDEPTQEGGSK